MSGPTGNSDFGLQQHREYETRASRYWRIGELKCGVGNNCKRIKWILVLVFTLVAILLVVWIYA